MKPEAAIKQQESVLQEYLDGLLMEATEPQVKEEVVAPAAVTEPLLKEEVVAPVTVVEPVLEVKAEVKVAASVTAVQPAVEVKKTQPVVAPSIDVKSTANNFKAQPHDQDDRPSWAQNEFECLLFNVAGLNLAVPLVLLGGVFAVDKELTTLFGQAPWFLGLLQTEQFNLRVVDTAHLIMPEKHRNLSQGGFSYVIRLGDSEWALACQKVDDAIKVLPKEVRWRSTAGARPWLAGTLKEKMCALVDVAALVTLLEQS